MSGNSELAAAVVIGMRVPGIPYRVYRTGRTTFLIPSFPLTDEEAGIASQFLRQSGFSLRNWEAMCLAYWESCVTAVPYEIGEVVVFPVEPTPAEEDRSVVASAKAEDSGRCFRVEKVAVGGRERI